MENESKAKQFWNEYVGDFSFRNILNLVVTFIAVGVSPFLRPDTDWKTLTWGWLIFTVIKVFFNLFTKKTMLDQTTENKLKTDTEILEIHKEIKESRLVIESKKYTKYLPQACNEENTLNRLDALYDKLNVKLTKAKTDEEVFNIADKLELVLQYQNALVEQKDTSEFRKALAKDLSSIKIETITPSSLYSKNDTTQRARKVGMNLDKAKSIVMRNSLFISIGIIVLLNFITLIANDFSWSLLGDVALNITVLLWNATMGVSGAIKIITEYKDVALYKSTFLKSFIVKAETYSQPNEQELKEEKEKERLRIKEEEQQKRIDEMERKKQERLDRIEDLKLEQEFKLKELEINAEIKKAEAQIHAKTLENNAQSDKQEPTLNIKVTTDNALESK